MNIPFENATIGLLFTTYDFREIGTKTSDGIKKIAVPEYTSYYIASERLPYSELLSDFQAFKNNALRRLTKIDDAVQTGVSATSTSNGFVLIKSTYIIQSEVDRQVARLPKDNKPDNETK